MVVVLNWVHIDPGLRPAPSRAKADRVPWRRRTPPVAIGVACSSRSAAVVATEGGDVTCVSTVRRNGTGLEKYLRAVVDVLDDLVAPGSSLVVQAVPLARACGLTELRSIVDQAELVGAVLGRYPHARLAIRAASQDRAGPDGCGLDDPQCCLAWELAGFASACQPTGEGGGRSSSHQRETYR